MTDFEKAKKEYEEDFEIRYIKIKEEQEAESLKREQMEEEAREKRIASYKAEELKLEEIEKKRNIDNNKNHSKSEGNKENIGIVTSKKYIYNEDVDSLTFGWWKTWPWLSLVFGTIYFLVESNSFNNGILVFSILALNILLNILILRYNKYAFLIATILSINPLLWIINGIYLKNRWKHPLVNNGIDLTKVETTSIKEVLSPIISNSISASKQIAESFKSIDSLISSHNQIENAEVAELQELVNKAISKGDTEMAQSLLKILERKKAV